MSNDMELYKDFYGNHAAIFMHDNNYVRLIIRDKNGKLLYEKTYTSYNGAKIAMGRKSDCWVKQEQN